MADVFVSYKKEDRALAADIVARLENAGYSVWWDTRLSPRESWDRMIEKELDAAKAVVVLWTPRSVPSEWVRSEAAAAKEAGKLIPLKLEACALPLAFRSRQTADLTAWDGNETFPEWRRALEWIRDLAGPDREKTVDAATSSASIVALQDEIARLREALGQHDVDRQEAPATPPSPAEDGARRIASNLAVAITAPMVGYSLVRAVVGRWLKTKGQIVFYGEPLLEITNREGQRKILSPATGVLHSIVAEAGAKIEVDDVLGFIARHN